MLLLCAVLYNRISLNHTWVAVRLLKCRRDKALNLLGTETRSMVRSGQTKDDADVSFGRPVLEGTGIPTAIVAERYKAGETIEELADDYERPSRDIQEAIRCELETKAA